MAEEKSKESAIETFKKEFVEFAEEFGGESDRAAVILGAAKLDYILYQCLMKYLIPNPVSTDELLEGDAPLSTFSAKINLVYRLGLIDAEFARALHLIRRIRNSFAHETTKCELNSGPHGDRIRELASPVIHFSRYQSFKKSIFPEKEGIAAEFFAVLALLVIRLQGLYQNITPLDMSRSHEMIPPVFYEEETPNRKQIQE
jgi:hypothetical protein